MSKKLYEESNVQEIASAIREKNEVATGTPSSETYRVRDMASAIRSLPVINPSDYRTADEQDVIDNNLDQKVNSLKSTVTKLTPAATTQDVGKALIIKTVDPTMGKPSAYEYGEAGDTVAEKLLANIIPGTTQSVTFDSNNKPATVVFSENGSAVRTDAFAWGTGAVTEVRTLSSGEYITMVTDLATLVTTISAIQRGA